MTYLRGVGPDLSDFALANYLDLDDGTDTLGLDTGNFGTPALFDPAYSHSKQAITRLLNLLGYDNTYLATVLLPQRWSQRNLSVDAMPAPSGEGYALSTGNWPVEFNETSKISSASHYWEWAGYFSYTKGLPTYQESPLSIVQRFDNIHSSAWGGKIKAMGLDETGEHVHIGTATVDGRGKLSS